MKKILLIILVLLAFSIFFTACGDKTETTTTPVTTQDPIINLSPGLYDAENTLLASWDELVNTYGMKADIHYDIPIYFNPPYYAPCYVLTNTSELQNGSKLVIGNIDKIGAKAFGDCTSLTSIYIPESVTLIGDSAFSGCINLTTIMVSENNPNYSGNGTALYNKDKTTLIDVSESVTSFIIPNTVTSIGDGAIGGCEKLTNITISDSVTSIGIGAFTGCTSLTSITLPDSLNSIELYAFSDCTSLTSIAIPNSVTKIGNSAFKDCTSLTSITIPDSVTAIDYAFGGCTNLAAIMVDENNPNYSSDGTALYNKDKTSLIQVPESVTSFTIPDSVPQIDGGAFANCEKLTSITLPNSITLIGNSAFWGCTSLTSINFAGTVEQWNAISKGENWNKNVPATEINCSDGTVTSLN